VYIAYLDDSDTKQKRTEWQVMSAVIVKDSSFRNLEVVMGAMADRLFTEDTIDKFTEFHACELYGGYGVFDGIDQDSRFAAITVLLNMLEEYKFSVVYGAVDLKRLREKVYGSADPMDIAFRICAIGVDKWIAETQAGVFQSMQKAEKLVKSDIDKLLGDCMVLFIADDFARESKASLQKSFRNIRKRYRGEQRDKDNLLKFVHDDMYFGDSKFSVGIQLADLCSYFIARHLNGDTEIEGFYKLIEPYIAYSQVEPEEKNATGSTIGS
jgi:Protein of unknown function (DUF3800)